MMFKSAKFINQEEGFTLIELLLVIALMAISVGITSDIMISLVRSYNKSSIINEVEQTANFVALKIENDLRNASNVSLGLNLGTQIQFTDENGSIVRYNVANGNIYRCVGCASYSTANSAALIPTLAVGQIIGGLTVTCTGASNVCFSLVAGTPQIVDITMSVSQANVNGSVTFEGQVPIQNTIVIRSTY